MNGIPPPPPTAQSVPPPPTEARNPPPPPPNTNGAPPPPPSTNGHHVAFSRSPSVAPKAPKKEPLSIEEILRKKKEADEAAAKVSSTLFRASQISHPQALVRSSLADLIPLYTAQVHDQGPTREDRTGETSEGSRRTAPSHSREQTSRNTSYRLYLSPCRSRQVCSIAPKKWRHTACNPHWTSRRPREGATEGPFFHAPESEPAQC